MKNDPVILRTAPSSKTAGQGAANKVFAASRDDQISPGYCVSSRGEMVVPKILTRYAICHKLYTDMILDNELYPKKYRKLWPYLLIKQSNTEEKNGFTSLWS